jgi:hypothetical protein
MKNKKNCCPPDVVTWSSVQDIIGWAIVGLMGLGIIIAIAHHSYYSGQIDGCEQLRAANYKLNGESNIMQSYCDGTIK